MSRADSSTDTAAAAPTAAATRPRVQGRREDEILDATLALLLEVGYDRLTMDAVAHRARASKATLYRRWSAKHTLVMDALLRSKRAPQVTDPDAGNLRDDLVGTFCGPGGLTQRDNSKLIAVVLTAVHTDDAFAAEFRERFLRPKLEVSRRIYRRARERGEIAAGVDTDLLGPALAAILLHRVLLLGAPVDRATVEAVVDQIIVPAATGRPTSPQGRP
ncbi:MAG TPA: TetR/AcrR family transcriptional regulator [Nocardioidaceae bacterium]